MIDLKEWVRFDYPTDDQLKLINQKKPANSADYTSEELMVVPIAAANNLVGYDSRKWSISSLVKMSADYANTTTDFMQDHDHKKSKQVIGSVFYSHLWQIQNLTKASMNYLLKYSFASDIDKEILKQEGYYQTTLYAYIEASSEIASDIKYGRRKDVSIGWYELPTAYCPLCSTSSKMVSFASKECPHHMPYWVFLRELISKEDKKLLAPYWIADDFRQAVEVSTVVDGNCSQAKIIDQEMFQALLG